MKLTAALDLFLPDDSACSPRSPTEKARGTTRGTDKQQHFQLVTPAVPHVPRVPLENYQGWNENDWRYAFDERAGILEYDAGYSRTDAERIARSEIHAMKTRTIH